MRSAAGAAQPFHASYCTASVTFVDCDSPPAPDTTICMSEVPAGVCTVLAVAGEPPQLASGSRADTISTSARSLRRWGCCLRHLIAIIGQSRAGKPSRAAKIAISGVCLPGNDGGEAIAKPV